MLKTLLVLLTTTVIVSGQATGYYTNGFFRVATNTAGRSLANIINSNWDRGFPVFVTNTYFNTNGINNTNVGDSALGATNLAVLDGSQAFNFVVTNQSGLTNVIALTNMLPGKPVRVSVLSSGSTVTKYWITNLTLNGTNAASNGPVWAGTVNTQPAVSTNGVDIFEFLRVGSNVFGRALGTNYPASPF